MRRNYLKLGIFNGLILKAEQLVPEFHLPNSNQDTIKHYQREYQYLTNLGRILKAVGKQKERELVDNTVDEVLCHYLQSWVRNDNESPISMEQWHTQAEIQAAFIETLGDDDARRLITLSEMLRTEGRFEELGQLAMAHLKKYQHRIVDRYLAKQFKQLEETMFQYIASKQRQELTAAQIQHFSKLASQMADARISDVTEFTSLTATDRAFLGLGASRLEQWFNNRKLFIITINIIAGLRIAASQLPYLTNAEQRNRCVLHLQKQLEQQCKHYSDNQIQHIIKQSFFAQPLM